MERLNSLNLKLEDQEEEILALNFEFAMLEKIPGDARVLDNFYKDVTQLRDVNSSLLKEITSNGDCIKKVVCDKERGTKKLQQLEFDLNMIECEGLRLEASLVQLGQVEIPELPRQLAELPEVPRQMVDLQEEPRLRSRIPGLPICDNKVTSDSIQFSSLCQVIMSPSTLV